jgi:N utilization substance protein B
LKWPTYIGNFPDGGRLAMTRKQQLPGGRRHRARGVVLSSLYALYTTGKDAREVFTGISEQENLAADPAEFAEKLFLTAVKHADEIDQMIRRAAVNWSFERIAFVDKNILRLAIAEFVFLKETAAKVAINEAIELAREYSSEDSGKFINGILDKIYHQIPSDADSVEEQDKTGSGGPRRP